MASGKEFTVPIQQGIYPFLDVLRERRPPYESGGISKETQSKLVRYFLSNATRIAQVRRNIVSLELTRTRVPYAAVVGIPIGVETEQSETIQPAVASVITSASQVDRPTILIPYLNFTAGKRNEQSKIARLHHSAKQMGKDIGEMIPKGSNVELQTVITHEPSGTTWPQRRTGMSDVALGTLDDTIWQSVFAERKWTQIHNTPYLQIDADTTIGEDTIATIADVLKEDEAIFVNGTMHYTGSLMNEKPVTVAQKGTNAKLIYFSEIMRRRMFDHLPSISLRGYLPDFGIAMKAGVLATLGGYEELDPQNESYFLQIAAMEAVGRSWGRTMLEQNYPNAHIDSTIAKRINGLVYYAPYEVNSSIRGIEANVARYGRSALVEFDQGENYITWTDFVQNPSKKQELELTAKEALPLIHAIYSAFKDRGGKPLQEDTHEDRDIDTLKNIPVDEMNLQELFSVLFSEPPVDEEKVVFSRLLYIPVEKRPKVTT